MSSIPWERLREGIEECLKNSQRLFSSANILILKKKFIDAMCLEILALEEIGKGIFLLKFLKTKKDAPKSEWKKYFHGPHAHVLKLDKVRKFMGIPTAEVEDWSLGLNLIKLTGFYVDWIENEWSSPEKSSLVMRIIRLPFLYLLMRHTKEAWDKLEKEFLYSLKNP